MLNVKYVVYKCLFLHACVYTLTYFVASMPGQSVIDGTQALGQISVDIEKLQPDFYIASCHKWLFGPKGTGILYLNKDFLNDTPPLFAGAYNNKKFDLIKG